MADTLTGLKSALRARIKELEEATEELDHLRGVLARLESSEPRNEVVKVKPAAPRQRRSRAKKAKAKPRRIARSGQRAEQVLALVRETPGITVPQLGEALKVDSTSLYRVVSQLSAEGVVAKRGREVFPLDRDEVPPHTRDEAPEPAQEAVAA